MQESRTATDCAVRILTDDPAMSDSATKSKPVPKPPRRWLRLLLGLFTVLLLLVGFAPNLVAWTPLRNAIASNALGGLAGSIDIGSASFGWFAVIEMRDVTLSDSEGKKVATLPRIVSSKTLLSLAMDRSDLGEFTLENPTLQIVADEQSTNLERMLVGMLKPNTKTNTSPPTLSLKIVDANLNIHDVPTKRTTTLEKTNLSLKLAGKTEPTASLSATVRDAGKLTAELVPGKSSVSVENFPLDALAPILRRLEPGTTLAGRLSAEASLERTAEMGRPTLRLVGAARATDVVVTTPALRGDTLRLSKVELPLDITHTGESTIVRRADLKCDVGSVSLRGSFDADEPVERLLVRPGLTVDAEVDLARVAKLVPRLLGVREGTTLHQGSVGVKLSSAVGQGDTVWKGEVKSSALRAERAGQKLEWNEPLAVNFTSRVKAGELPTFDAFECRSEFLSATASGSAEACQVRAVLSLDRLAARLGSLIDLGGVTLAGGALVKLDAKRSPNNEVHLVGSMTLDRFAIADRSGRALREAQAAVGVDARVRWTANKPIRVESASLGMNLGGDTLEASLREPLADAMRLDGLRANVKLTGDLTRWRNRAAGVVTIPADMLVAGTGTITGIVAPGVTTSQFSGEAELRNFVYGPPAAPTWREPLVKLTLAGAVEPGREMLRLERMSLTREALVCEAKGTFSQWTTARTIDLTGALTYDLDRLSPQLREFLGADFIATGQAKRDFQLSGNFTRIANLKSGAAIAWSSARTHGFDVGPGELKLALSGGTLATNTIEANFSGGRVRTQVSIHLDPAPQEAMLAPGTLLERAKLTSQATNGAVGYALPVIANSASAEGELSFVLEGNRIPLADPKRATVRGKLIVHRAVVSAGPIVSEIANLLRLGPTTVTLASENVVPVRMEAGRVHHENLTLKLGAYTVRTSGSVGLDGSVALVAEVPLPPSLFPNNPRVSQALANKTVPVPIGGTLTQPRLDASAFQQAVAKMAGELAVDVARDTGRDLIDKQLNKVLPGGFPGLPFPRR